MNWDKFYDESQAYIATINYLHNILGRMNDELFIRVVKYNELSDSFSVKWAIGKRKRSKHIPDKVINAVVMSTKATDTVKHFILSLIDIYSLARLVKSKAGLAAAPSASEIEARLIQDILKIRARELFDLAEDLSIILRRGLRNIPDKSKYISARREVTLGRARGLIRRLVSLGLSKEEVEVLWDLAITESVLSS